MFIDTRTKEGMIQSLVTIFGMTEKELNKLPFDVVMLDERDSLCTNEKLKIVLLSIIKHLCGRTDNIGLRLEDGKDIDGNYLIDQYIWDNIHMGQRREEIYY